MFHPTEGPDAFPNLMGFAPEKFLAKSSFVSPTNLFKNGQIAELTIAGEPVVVALNRSDTAEVSGSISRRVRR
ncbi:hypothetical protein GCM10011487_45040 [Steroidobacter agaridevorans]|uniref:Uncharacterized protein n=1 Tax=Steroidobacter agaridevorans TaxID=2695856 RepID=A0A829YGY2_9GAMM|nr:hypothetical protein GCM10011487_45040 [Steroidobacter agaridevorans]